MADNLKAMTKKRRAVRTNITKMLNEPSEEDKDYVLSLFDKLNILDDVILTLQCQDDGWTEEMVDEDQARVSEYQRRISLFKMETKKETSKAEVKLPDLKLVEYDLGPRNYQKWLGQYKMIERANVSYEEKFHYVSQTLKGRGKRIIEAYTPTEENLKQVIEQLKRAFGKPEYAIEILIRDILQLILNDNKPSISYLYDQLSSKLRSLEVLGLTSSQYEAILYPLVESSLPKDLLKLWTRFHDGAERPENARSLSNVSDSSSKLIRLMDFLGKEVESEERMKLASENFKKEKTPFYQSPKHITFEALHSCETKENDLNSYSHVCGICKNKHRTADCKRAKTMTSEEKREALYKNRYCFLCLKPNHKKTHCRSNVTCLNCKRRHNTILCEGSAHKEKSSMVILSLSNLQIPRENGRQEVKSEGQVNKEKEVGKLQLNNVYKERNVTRYVVNSVRKQNKKTVGGESVQLPDKDELERVARSEQKDETWYLVQRRRQLQILRNSAEDRFAKFEKSFGGVAKFAKVSDKGDDTISIEPVVPRSTRKSRNGKIPGRFKSNFMY